MLFKRLVWSVWAIIAIYSALFAVVHAWLACAIVLAGTLLFKPLILWLEKRQFHSTARLSFLVGCNLYIFVSSLGLGHQVSAEYYYLPATMLPVLIFDLTKRRQIFAAISTSLLLWAFTVYAGADFVPPWMLAQGAPVELIKQVNFAGAFSLSLVFLSIFVKTTFQLKDLLVAEVKNEASKHLLTTATMSEGLILLDYRGNIIFYNPAATQILGVTSGEVDERSSTDPRWRIIQADGSRLPEADHPGLVALRTGKPVIGTILGVPQSDNSIRWVKVNANPDGAGTERKAIVTFSDITQLMQSQTENRFVLDSLGIGVWKYNPVSLELHWDSSMYALHGLNAANFTDPKVAWASVLSPFAQTRAITELDRAMKTGKDFNTSTELKCSDGTEKFIAGRGTVIRNDQGEPTMIYGVSWDRTKEVRDERLVEAAMLEMQRIFEMSVDLLCVVNAEGYFTRVSPSFQSILGFSVRELLAKPLTEFIHPDDLAATNTAVKRLGDGTSVAHFEHRFLTRSGRYRLISWVGQSDPQNRSIYATGRDITELKASESRNKEILKAIDSVAIVAMTDVHGKITQVNENFCKISGYRESELLGQDHRIVNSGLHSSGFFKEIWKTILSGKSWTGDIGNRAKDGSTYYVRTVITPLRDLNDNIEQFMAIRFDVTEEKKTQLELVQQKNFLESILGNLPNMVFVKDYQNGLSFTLLNPAGEKLLGIPQQRLIGRNDYDFYPIEEADRLIAQDHEIFLGRRTHETNRESIETPNGKRWLRTHRVPTYTEDGSPHLIIGISIDITEELQLQKDLEFERSKALHNAKLASLGEMAAGIAHEINNPLAVIAGNTALLKKLRDDPEKFAAKLEVIGRSTDRISKIVRGLKKFSRSSEPVTHQPVSLAEIIGEVEVLTEAKSKRQSTPIEIRIETQRSIDCDGVEIEQVLVNLINNGIDAVQGLAEKWVRLTAFDDGWQVVVRVMDSGTGISAEVEKKLFEPFFTTKQVGEGTGLGLSIAKGILDQHRATLTLNRDFANTCFEIRFARATEVPHAA